MTPELERRIRRLSHTELLQAAELVGDLLAHQKSANSDDGMTAAEFKAGMWQRHRPAFTLFLEVSSLVEEVVSQARDIQASFPRALDMLFLQGYKSFCSVYLLSVHGHGEDAATILRRLLELSAQAIYLTAEPKHSIRQELGSRYIAYFWAQAHDLLESDLDDQVKAYWKEAFESHKDLISFDKNGKPLNWWGSKTIFSLFEKVGFEDIYRGDYGFWSNFTHGTSQGILVEYRAGHAEIRSDHFVSQMLVAGCRYMLGMTRMWNDHFQFLDEDRIERLIGDCKGFQFNA